MITKGAKNYTIKSVICVYYDKKQCTCQYLKGYIPYIKKEEENYENET